MTDPITDMLNRIRNAQAVSHQTVDIPWSKMKYQIAKILERCEFVGNVEQKGRQSRKIIRIVLKYRQPSSVGMVPIPEIEYLKRVSKPGRRVYRPVERLKSIRGKDGIVIVSTPKGLMTDKEARKQKVGGEVICEVW